ncbi:carbohydrate ABC transporter permease [Tessaracoccus rhinocerotis]|uniref:Carbohydrate ABC transporter permease n=1 Tax=Tessaracoccus rhinocerotis TaxID=1689449 RepID=A0A553K4K7_9ACTN|nr:carbohydrate ABC transporter permease [Tessaracoccus rhinocerotis]TRY19645.1 carbohydrate ABC transporter permease [Tessaracoccus rhinocerotis]
MNTTRKSTSWIVGIVGILVTTVVFLVPFAFVLTQASKSPQEAARLEFTWPEQFMLWSNVVQVFETRDFMLITAFVNSTILTVASVFLMVLFGSMIAYVLSRRKSRINGLINGLVLAGLIVPPAVVPTIWLLQGLGLFKTLPGLVFIEVAFGLSFTVLIMRAFVRTIPREIDEAAIIDGAGPVRLFFQMIFPLLRSVIVTVVVVQSVTVFNDFQNPLYFLPGDDNATVQLTLFNFRSQFSTDYNLLFANILIITVPLLVMYLVFQRQIVSGMTSGAVKG